MNRIEGQVLTIYDKIQEEQRKISDDMMGHHPDKLKVKEGAQPEVYQLLQYIMDKLHAIDTYLRNEFHVKNYTGYKTHESSAEEVKQKKELEKK